MKRLIQQPKGTERFTKAEVRILEHYADIVRPRAVLYVSTDDCSGHGMQQQDCQTCQR